VVNEREFWLELRRYLLAQSEAHEKQLRAEKQLAKAIEKRWLCKEEHEQVRSR
jgi:hypothetical protein